MCVLQDFEAITPNLLARTIETVEGGGLVVLLLKTMTSLKQLFTMTMVQFCLFTLAMHIETLFCFAGRPRPIPNLFSWLRSRKIQRKIHTLPRVLLRLPRPGRRTQCPPHLPRKRHHTHRRHTRQRQRNRLIRNSTTGTQRVARRRQTRQRARQACEDPWPSTGNSDVYW